MMVQDIGDFDELWAEYKEYVETQEEGWEARGLGISFFEYVAELDLSKDDVRDFLTFLETKGLIKVR